MKHFKLIFKNELLSVWREPKFWIPFTIPPIFILVSQILSGVTGALSQSLFLLMGVLFGTMSVGLTADSFAGERERSTLEMLLISPIQSGELFLGKLCSVLWMPLSFALVGQVLFSLFSSLRLETICLGLIHSLAVTLFISSGALFFSLKLQSVRSASQSSLLFLLPIYFITQIFSTWILADFWGFIGVVSTYLILSVGVYFMALQEFKKLKY